MNTFQAIFFTFLVLVNLVSSLAGENVLPNEIRVDAEQPRITPNVTSCDLDLCFAVDGSSSIPSSQFKRQQNLVSIIINRLPREQVIGLAAVQYGLASALISPFTEDRIKFRTQVRRSVQLNSDDTFLVAGINFCFAEIFTRPVRRRKIILLGDGMGNIGADPVDRARLFERVTGGELLAAAFGTNVNRSGLASIVGGENNVFNGRLDVRMTADAIISRLCT